MHKLIIAATPIGNILDVSDNLLTTLTNNNIFYCEDTRVSKKLFNILNIDTNKKFVSYHNYNENEKIESFENDIKLANVVLLSDAGYPLISDPGFSLVSYCLKNKISIEVVNGPCSIIHALVKSGFNLENFMFLGFLGHKKQEQINFLNKYKNIETVFVIYESIHRLFKTLENLEKVFEYADFCVAKELTKMHENFFYGRPSEIINQIQEQSADKGEFVILINNKNNLVNMENDWKSKVDFLISLKLSKQDIIKIIMFDYKEIKKNEIYNYLLKNEK